jgi:hypothetical protein
MDIVRNRGSKGIDGCPLTLMTYAAPPRMSFSFLCLHPPTATTPAAMHTPSCALPPGIPMDVDCTQTFKPLAQTCYHCGQTSHRTSDMCYKQYRGCANPLPSHHSSHSQPTQLPSSLGVSVTHQIHCSSKSWANVPRGGCRDPVDGYCGQAMHIGPH